MVSGTHNFIMERRNRIPYDLCAVKIVSFIYNFI